MLETGKLEDRELFVKQLGELLSQTRAGIIGVELVRKGEDMEYAAVCFKDGYRKFVNIYADSYMAIIRDVVNHLD